MNHYNPIMYVQSSFNHIKPPPSPPQHKDPDEHQHSVREDAQVLRCRYHARTHHGQAALHQGAYVCMCV